MRQLTKHILTACVPRHRLLVRGRKCAAQESLRLCLTFDDGPHPIHTPALLDKLLSHDLVGTFFVIGKHAQQHPDLIRRICDEGHQVANHTWEHADPHRVDRQTLLDEVRRTDDLIHQLTGYVPNAIRPPKGDLNWLKLTGLWGLQKTVVLWNVDPRDYRMQSKDEAVAWCDQYQPGDADILLFHDNHPWSSQIIERLVHKGVFEQFGTAVVSDMVGKKQPRIESCARSN